MHTKEHARKISKRAYPKLKPCEKCGTLKNIHRHHEDYQKPLEIMFLCRVCHVARHKELGNWGHGPKKFKKCVICNKEFVPKGNHHKIKSCGRECFKELGRLAAFKRRTKK